MNINTVVKDIGKKFVYLADKKFPPDAWYVMPERTDGKLCGDCDDFSLTALWLACDASIWKFIWRVIILHSYRLYFAKTINNQKHCVGYAEGMWFDNWTCSAMPKEQFIEKTGHKIYFFFPSVLILVFMFFGMFYRRRSRTWNT